MTNSADRLVAAVARVGNPTVVGLDTRREHLPWEFIPKGDSAAEVSLAITDYNMALIDLLSPIVGCVKVQIACYEALGLCGMRAFSKTLCYARERGMVTIADAKRNDIGSTAKEYAEAFLGDGDFAADFVTVNPYLGEDGIEPFLDRCRANGRGIFVLVKTSNPSSAQLQDLESDGLKIYEHVARLVDSWGSSLIGESGFSSVGAVVGATWPQQAAELRKIMTKTPFLVPGYGAQGATGKDVAASFTSEGTGAVVNASRSILAAHKKRPDMSWRDAVLAEAVRMRDDINDALGVKA